MDNQQMAPQQAPQQPQQKPDIFSPQSGMSVNKQLAAYRQHVAALTAETQSKNDSEQVNPWTTDQISPAQLQKDQTDHQTWLMTQPVAYQLPEQFDEEQHANLMANLKTDPAIKEIDDQFTEVLQTLGQYVQSGHITKEQAMAHLSEAAPMIDEALWKHHGPHSPTHNQSLLDHPDSYNTPNIVKKLKGGTNEQ